MGYFFTILATFWNSLISGVSMHLVFSVTGIFFLGLPTVSKVSSYTLAILEKDWFSPASAFLIALLISAILGAVFAFIAFRISAESFAALSIGSILATEAVFRSWDSFTGGTLGISGIMRPDIVSSLPHFAISVMIFSIFILSFEAIILQAPFGRALRAYREAPYILDSMGIHSIRLAQSIIIITSMIISVAASILVWRVQFIDPSISGIPLLIELLTISIIAFRPRLRALVLASIFVTLLPEILRFFHLPDSMFGQLRILIYSVLLLTLLHIFASYFHFSKRSI